MPPDRRKRPRRRDALDDLGDPMPASCNWTMIHESIEPVEVPLGWVEPGWGVVDYGQWDDVVVHMMAKCCALGLRDDDRTRRILPD